MHDPSIQLLRSDNARILGFVIVALAAVAFVGCSGEGGGGTGQDAAADAVEAVDVAGTLTQTTACASCGGNCSEESWVYGTAYHDTAPISYTESPPAAGTHDPCWHPWGAHTDGVPARRFVHNLEHGGIVLAYECPEGCETDVAALEAAAKASGRPYIVTPFAGMPTRFVALAWNHRLLTECVDEAAIVAFAKAYCPGAPEQFSDGPGPSCMP